VSGLPSAVEITGAAPAWPPVLRGRTGRAAVGGPAAGLGALV